MGAVSKRVFEAGSNEPLANYHLLTSLVIPRPIAWVSTISADGVPNLAPHSFFTVASTNPPVIAFTSIGEKDTVRNLRGNPEFVVSLATTRNWRQVNQTAAMLPPEVDEFVQAGIASELGDRVAVPRPADSPAHLECRVQEIRPIGNCFMVLGAVVAFVVAEGALGAQNRPLADGLNPVSKLGADEWAPLTEVFTEPRPTVQR